MKIIFLDIDGVLNNSKFINQHYLSDVKKNFKSLIDSDAIFRLNQIIDTTGALIVISSSWRIQFSIPTIDANLREHGFTGYILGCTKVSIFEDDPILTRGDEIIEWISHVGATNIENWIALDDESHDEMKACNDHFIQTKYSEGLLDSHVKKAIEVLNLK